MLVDSGFKHTYTFTPAFSALSVVINSPHFYFDLFDGSKLVSYSKKQSYLGISKLIVTDLNK